MVTDSPEEGKALASEPTEKGTEENHADDPRSTTRALTHGLSQAVDWKSV